MARFAVSAGRPINFQLTLTQPAKGSGSTLVVASAKALSPDMAASAGLDLETLRKTWQDRIDAPAGKAADEKITRFETAARNRLVLQRNFPAACHMLPPPRRPSVRLGATASAAPTPAASITAPQPAASSGSVSLGAPAALRAQVPKEPAQDPRKLFEEWNDNVRGQGQWVGYFSRAVDGIRSWGEESMGSFGAWVGKRLQGPPPKSGINSQTSLIVAQNILGDTTDDVWTFVTAPTSAMLGESVGCLIDPRVWRQVNGRMSLLDASEGTVKSVASENARLIATQPLSIGNIRLIAASWLSLNQSVYVAASLLLSLVLAGATVWLIRNVGRKQES